MARVNVKDWLTTEGLTLIEGWARDGLTDEQMMHNIGCSSSTFYKWKKENPEISEALKSGKEVIDRKVENALLKRALGYSFDEITYEYGEETKRVTKQMAPDTTAQIFWLKNRDPVNWRDKHDVKHSGEVTNKNINMSGMSEEELRKLVQLDD